MEGIKLLFVVVFALGVERTYAQQASNFRLLTGAEAQGVNLGQNPELLEVAALTGDRVVINITGVDDRVAVMQENVNALLDCFPFLSRFPGGRITWLQQRLDEFGNPVGGVVVIRSGPMSTIQVTGPFNRYLNITRTRISAAGADPNAGIYTCRVCIGQGTRQVCRDANTTIPLVGSPPDLDCGDPNDGAVMTTTTYASYKIGTNFCLVFGGTMATPRTQARLELVLLNMPGVEDMAEVFPAPPDVTVEKDGVIYYSLPRGVTITPTMEFMMAFPLLTSSTALSSVVVGDRLVFSSFFTGGNASMALSMRRMIFDSLLGTWTATFNNSLGSETCSSTIRECGPPPVLPGCMGPLFPADRENVSVGCAICIPEGTYLNLDCGVISGNTPELMYSWSQGNDTISTARAILVRFEGSYTCTVTNLDGMDSETTDVFFNPRVTFSTTIATLQDTTLTSERGQTGCQRLQNSTEIPGVDRCALVGERITFRCEGSNSDNTTIIDPMGRRFPTPHTVAISSANTNTAAGNYTCELSATGPCGGTIGVLNLAIYDPARINRIISLPPDTQTIQHIGADRPQQSVEVPLGNMATLYCPTTGLQDPTTGWRRITYDSQGQPIETPLTSTRSEPVNGVNTEILEISPFDRDDAGTYVCRTSNIAGQDAGVVSLVGPEAGIWVPGQFSACQPYNCSRGFQTRSVVCRSDRDNRVLPDNECPPPRPATTRRCTGGPCFTTPTWRAFDWSPCSRGCGGGYRSRIVVCHIPRTGVVIPDSRCSGTKPPLYESCFNTCCVSDLYPGLCRASGTGMCGMATYQQSCCWTCQSRDGPPPTPAPKKVSKH